MASIGFADAQPINQEAILASARIAGRKISTVLK